MHKWGNLKMKENNIENTIERKPFLTRFFEEVMKHVPVNYREFDFERANKKI